MMPSAVDFLPSHIIVLMNLATSGLLYTGSGKISRFGTSLLLGIYVPGSRSQSRSLKGVEIDDYSFDYFFLPPLAAPAAAPSFGRFAPYFERPCFRLATPTESSVPRTMW